LAPQVGLHTELARLAAAKWRALTGRLGNGHISDRRLGLLLKSWAGEGAEASEASGQAGIAGCSGRETVKVRRWLQLCSQAPSIVGLVPRPRPLLQSAASLASTSLAARKAKAWRRGATHG
jgi:hypothetical protein